MNLHIGMDLSAAAILLTLILIGYSIRGLFGFCLMSLGFAGFIWSGIDSAIQMFSPEWSFLERLYHFGWVWVGILAAEVYSQAWRAAWRRVHGDGDS